MATPTSHDQRVRQAEIIISQVLRGGVVASAALISLGALLFFIRIGQHTMPPPTAYTLTTIWQGLWRGEPLAIIMSGLLLLLITPVLRVAVSVIAFAWEGDRRYVIITLIVLLILLISFFLGKGGA